MNGVRELVWETLRSAAGLGSLGYVPEAILPGYTPDSPPLERFLVLRWGPTTPGVGGANSADLGVWIYNREPDYGPISEALMVCRAALVPLAGARLPANRGILGFDWRGSGADLFDDAYVAYVRADSYAVTATGN